MAQYTHKSLTQERLKQVLKYIPDTGLFVRKSTIKQFNKGSIAGSVDSSNSTKYLRIRVDGVSYKAHRLAFLYMTGLFPSDIVDHIDGNGLNNSWENLRQCTRKQNSRNSRKPLRNSSGVKGVSWCKRSGKWIAQLRVDYKTVFIGYFEDITEASAAVSKARDRLHLDFARQD